MSLHTSTKERLEFYEVLYEKIFEVIKTTESISDIACGLNPFSIPLMNLKEPLKYFAYDIDSSLINLINQFFVKINFQPLAKTQDVIFNPPKEAVDITFVFKFLPIIEKIKRSYILEFLKGLQSQYIVISFPSKSISGKEKGMIRHYREFYLKKIKENFSIVSEFSSKNEIFIILNKNG